MLRTSSACPPSLRPGRCLSSRPAETLALAALLPDVTAAARVDAGLQAAFARVVLGEGIAAGPETAADVLGRVWILSRGQATARSGLTDVVAPAMIVYYLAAERWAGACSRIPTELVRCKWP